MIGNRRDLGGMVTEDGRVIREGCLIRSAHLGAAAEEDLRGISEVIDLRTPGEREEVPDVCFGAAYVPIPIFESLAQGISHEEETKDSPFPDLGRLYAAMMRECADSYRRVLKRIMDHDFGTGAVLWHCTEGKDRCGMTTALVLEALGVGPEKILADYLRTNEVNLPRARAMRENLARTKGEAYAEGVYRAYIADAHYLACAREAMGPDYLRGKLGFTGEELSAFREKVLGPEASSADAG